MIVRYFVNRTPGQSPFLLHLMNLCVIVRSQNAPQSAPNRM